MTAGKIAPLIGSLFVVGLVCPAQTPLELKPVAVVSVANRTANGILEPIKCDSNSNIYVLAFQESDPPGGTPVTKITPDGKASVFPLPTVKDKRLQILDFAPGANGGVVLLVRDNEGQSYVESHTEDGGLDWKFSLPAELRAMQVAVSPKGKILVCGLWSSAAGPGGESTKPFAAVFDKTGREEREVSLTEDTQASGGAPSAAGAETGSSAKNVRRAISYSSAQFSSNESFVLARLSAGGAIYIISPDGFEVNTVHPSTPPDTQLSSVKVDGDTIAALFFKRKKGSAQSEISDVFISLLNSQTGEEQGQYHHSSWQLGAALACYKSGLFTFVTTGDNNQLQIVRAAAK